MKQRLLKDIIEKKKKKVEFAIVTDLQNGKCCIYEKDTSVEEITLALNNCLEKMILNNPNQWIWSHNRWK